MKYMYVLFLLISNYFVINIPIFLEDRTFQIDIISLENNKALVIINNRENYVIALDIKDFKTISTYLKSRYEKYTILELTQYLEYEIASLKIVYDNYLSIGDIFCFYDFTNQKHSKIDDCKYVYIHNYPPNENTKLEEIALLIHDNKYFSNQMIENIYIKWIDNYFLANNSLVELKIKANDFEINEYKISVK